MIKFAFPVSGDRVTMRQADSGMELRDWFATFAPEPTKEQIDVLLDFDRNANPHNDTYKPRRRSRFEIIADLKFTYADVMMARREIKK